MNTKYFDCECGCYMHNMRVVWFQDEWMKESNIEKELYIDLMLNQYHPWYKRIWIAFLYVFNKERYRPYDCVTLSYDKAMELKEFLGDITDAESTK